MLGSVHDFFRLRPEQFNIVGLGDVGFEQSLRVYRRSDLNDRFSITGTSCACGKCRVEVSGSTAAYDSISFRASPLAKKSGMCLVHLETDQPVVGTIDIPVQVVEKADISIKPKVLFVRGTQDPSGQKVKVTSTAALTISEIVCDREGIAFDYSHEAREVHEITCLVTPATFSNLTGLVKAQARINFVEGDEQLSFSMLLVAPSAG